MSLKIIFGKNKTGKTKYLESRYPKTNPNNLFIEAEIDLEGILKGNTGGTGKNAVFSPHKKVFDFLNTQFAKPFKVRISNDEDYEKINLFKNNADRFQNRMTDIYDPFFEPYFRNCFNTRGLEQEFEYNFMVLEFLNNNKRTMGSSGSLNYSLIKLLYEMISDGQIMPTEEFTLIIDEVEKFLHPELVHKIANMIIEISEKLDVIVTTHSPLFLEKIFAGHRKKFINESTCNIEYLLFTKYDDNEQESTIVTLDNDIITETLVENNSRITAWLADFLFSSRCFFIEGLIDNSIINDIISKNDLENPYTIIDCNGKTQIDKMLNIVRDLSIIRYYKICLFYDSDGDENNERIIQIEDEEREYVSSVINRPDLERALFDIVKKNNVEYIDTNSGPITLKNFKREKIDRNSNFIFTLDWIKRNSTKMDIENQVEAIEEQIINFMTE
ncbi:AAA family ATPase [Mycoplasma sp. 1232]|uniref:AAA family ATPase n=1 Tax=Mycoplasma sp. 1232 TaxID=3108527 RepID=UPI002B26216D|nr:AAA family ATPase [Mycoplasma sp. 1232]MEA4333632.1 AAA family ATPase [Mycoplasma sp. 1232]